MNSRQRELYDKVKNAKKHLDLAERQIGDAEAQAIAEALKVNTTVTELSLYQNRIGATGARAIAEALQMNKAVTTLDLRENQIGAAGAQAIAEALKVNTTLAVLSLYQNQIGDAGAQAIAEALRENKTVTRLGLYQNQTGDAGALAIAEALKVNTTLGLLDLRFNCIGKAGLQAIGEARQVNRTLTTLLIDRQVHPRLFSLLPRRLATAEDLQNVFHLLASGQELKDQPISLPALPAELAELIMDKAHYWQGVQHTKRSHFYDSPERILKVTLPQRIDGGSVRVKAIQVFRDMGNRFDSNGSSRFDLIVLDEQRAVQYECSVKPTLVDSSLELVTILPASHPVIRQMRAGWQVQVRASKSSRDVVFESLRVGYV
ncbi:hypothetical protein CAOG_07672 [Capsaspora owczarzaki ATCC 30864]|uniref:NOD3 protein n=1 Tax=Capsaspora owczarzaki (strain ATCC 30864) TaxID=595528 RepID=A0A0D2WW93_CAPO3|nr:hypothetical protein CAOG_07672 [Capsaspora owczarzaki ATCC 30864]KJE97230.1 hypothetical protein CAOG_007672 [Capsaspora owczarzaki ATCC 30864]|eukprot:XP_004343546.1 hypothetical protein CAOG_07672 [Capsaspora owczarzaki ATCC 30864]